MAVANKSVLPYGGYDNDFVETVPDRLICSTVCTKVLRDPHLTSCCGQHVCESCLNYWFGKHHEKSCPHCRARGGAFNHFLDKKLKREILELKIQCIHKTKGCEWKGELQNLDNHINSNSGCGFVEVECPNGPKYPTFLFDFITIIDIPLCPKIIRKDLNEHMNIKCDLRSVICTHCNEKQQYFYLLEDHYKVCTQYPLPCPNKCGTINIPRKDLHTHRSKCPLEPVTCPFAEAGCTVELVRNQLDKHMTDNQQSHLLQLMADYVKAKTALSITQGRLESMQEGLSRELQSIRVTEDLEPTLKSIQTNLGSSQNKISRDGEEHGLQFSVPPESFFKDNKEWYSPAFYVKKLKVCVRAKLNTETDGLDCVRDRKRYMW